MAKNGDYKSTLKIKNGIPQPSSINKNALIRFREKKKKQYTVDEYISGIVNGSRTILSQAITLIESSQPLHFDISQQIIEKCLPYAGNSIRVGITGVPGVGKSSFIETLGNKLTEENHKLAVLTIDPSSKKSKGSILGDKTRMETLSTNPKAFIRPSPSSGTLGGVAGKTRETIVLCEAAGFDIIFVETVGVGQSEIAVHSMVDFFLLLMLAGAGDELQGIKRGIIEMADAIAITKADGTNINKAEHAKAEYTHALHLFPQAKSGWNPRVFTCSAPNNTGIDEIWNSIMEYKSITEKNGSLAHNRGEQARYWMYETINQQLKDNFYNHQEIKNLLLQYEKNVLAKKLSPFTAAKNLLSKYFNT